MLHITVPAGEYFNNNTQEFLSFKETELVLEHSLVSLSKWEQKWHKPFLSKDSKTNEELIDYVKCMTLTQNVNPKVYNFLSSKNLEDINNYINDSMTATTFSEAEKKGSREIITSEIIYYWMIALQIPFECQKWHLNRLLTLIKVCNIKNQPGKKMSTRDIMSRNKALNAARRNQLKSRG